MTAMARGTALVANAAAVTVLTGIQGLANLEAGGGITLADLLTSASDAIFDRLEADGADPTLLENATRFERAVAWEFVAILYSSGSLPAPAGDTPSEAYDRARGMVDRYYMQVRPRLSSGDEAARATDGLPVTLNFEPGYAFGPNPYAQSDPEFLWDDLPDTR